MSSLKEEFESLLASLNRQTFEHVRFNGIYIDEPEFLVVLYHQDQPVRYFGGYLVTAEELAVAITGHAADYLQCTVFNDVLAECSARFICRSCEVWFCYSRNKINFVINRNGIRDS